MKTSSLNLSPHQSPYITYY